MAKFTPDEVAALQQGANQVRAGNLVTSRGKLQSIAVYSLLCFFHLCTRASSYSLPFSPFFFSPPFPFLQRAREYFLPGGGRAPPNSNDPQSVREFIRAVFLERLYVGRNSREVCGDDTGNGEHDPRREVCDVVMLLVVMVMGIVVMVMLLVVMVMGIVVMVMGIVVMVMGIVVMVMGIVVMVMGIVVMVMGIGDGDGDGYSGDGDGYSELSLGSNSFYGWLSLRLLPPALRPPTQQQRPHLSLPLPAHLVFSLLSPSPFYTPPSPICFLSELSLGSNPLHGRLSLCLLPPALRPPTQQQRPGLSLLLPHSPSFPQPQAAAAAATAAAAAAAEGSTTTQIPFSFCQQQHQRQHQHWCEIPWQQQHE
ncbi:unnamed protein product [Closterium sp. NIES-65]|nr:unnamed protein product [Closterium sp. NIES-65]